MAEGKELTWPRTVSGNDCCWRDNGERNKAALTGCKAGLGLPVGSRSSGFQWDSGQRGETANLAEGSGSGGLLVGSSTAGRS